MNDEVTSAVQTPDTLSWCRRPVRVRCRLTESISYLYFIRERWAYPRLLHLLEGELEQVGQLVYGQHGHGFALRLYALRHRYFLFTKSGEEKIVKMAGTRGVTCGDYRAT